MFSCLQNKNADSHAGKSRLSPGKQCALCSHKAAGILPQDGSVTARVFNLSEVLWKHWLVELEFACNDMQRYCFLTFQNTLVPLVWLVHLCIHFNYIVFCLCCLLAIQWALIKINESPKFPYCVPWLIILFVGYSVQYFFFNI